MHVAIVACVALAALALCANGEGSKDTLNFTSYFLSTIIHPHDVEVSIGVPLQATEFIEIPSGSTVDEHVFQNFRKCQNILSTEDLEFCEKAKKLVVMAIRNTAVTAVETSNGFGHTTFRFETPDYLQWNQRDTDRQQEALYKNITRMAILSNHGNGFKNSFDNDIYKLGYCSPLYCCPLSIPLAFIETPRVASTATKQWITEQEREAGFSAEGWNGHFPRTPMTCCQHGHHRVKFMNVRNPYSKFISVFRGFFLGQMQEGGVGGIPLTRDKHDPLWLRCNSPDGFKWRDLSGVVSIVAQYKDPVVDTHFQSQMYNLLEVYVGLHKQYIHPDHLHSAPSNPLTEEGFREWLGTIHLLRLETHAADWTSLLKNTLCTPKYGYNCTTIPDPPGYSDGSSKGDRNVLQDIESNWLTKSTLDLIYHRYHCDFIAFGYEKWVITEDQALHESQFASGSYNFTARSSEMGSMGVWERGGRIQNIDAAFACMREAGMFVELHGRAKEE